MRYRIFYHNGSKGDRRSWMFSGNGCAPGLYRNSIKESKERQLEERSCGQRRCNEYDVGFRKYGRGSVVWRDSRTHVALEPVITRNAPYSEAGGDYGSVAPESYTQVDSSIRLIYICWQTERRIQFQAELGQAIKGVLLLLLFVVEEPPFNLSLQHAARAGLQPISQPVKSSRILHQHS
jgi:hypothetical protein